MKSSERPCDVLLVDDDTDALGWLLLEMKAANFIAHACQSGDEAVAYLATHIPGAILLDVQMPGMDGFQTCGKIRQISEDVPIIFMTGLGETEDILRGFEAGANDYVTKPLSLPVVMARLQAHTRTARLVRATREVINASNAAMLAIDRGGALLWCNAHARQIIQSVSPDAELAENGALPGAFVSLSESDPLEGDTTIDLPRGKLAARCISDLNNPVRIFTLNRLNTSVAPMVPAGSPLTDREGEVLLWVARGKTNRDIADILGMSPRTVNKHLEHIFEKLGVETRTAAAAAAARALNPP